MPVSIFILQHWKKQQQIFLQNLKELREKNQPTAIHDLRVAVKKLRSYLKLLAIVFKKKDNKESFEKTEQLFSVLGKHRDIEMGLSLLHAFEKKDRVSYTVFSNHLKKVLRQTGGWVQNALKDYNEEELTDLTLQLEESLKETNSQELLDKVRVIIDKEFRKAKRLANHLARQTHQVRKLFKDIFYWATLCPKDVLLDEEVLKKIKKSFDHLGDWQDHEMLHQKIKHFRKDFVPDAKEEYALLKELEKGIMNKKEKILDNAKDTI